MVTGAPTVTLVSKVQAQKDWAEAGGGTLEVSKRYQNNGKWLGGKRMRHVRAQHHFEIISSLA